MMKSFSLTIALCLFAMAGSVSAGGFTKAGTVPVTATSPEDGVYLPNDPWEEAMRAGGEVRLGAGEFLATEVLELDQSLRVTGMGPEETLLAFATDGGMYAEQLAIFEAEDGGGQFFFSDLGIMQANEVLSDLVTVVGNVSATFDNVAIGLAWDTLYGDPEADNYYGVGIYASAGANLRVVNSSIYGNGTHGIGIWNSKLFVNGTEFVLNWAAGVLAIDSDITVINSHFEMNDVGIEAYGSGPRMLANNTFLDNEWQDVFEGE